MNYSIFVDTSLADRHKMYVTVILEVEMSCYPYSE
jgi:hypothetical protein